MRRRLGIYGASDESVALIGRLAGSPRVEVVRVFAPDAAALIAHAARDSAELGDFLLLVSTDDEASFRGSDDLSVVVDATPDGRFARRHPDAIRHGVQVVTPRAARLLWGYDAAQPDRRAELLQVLAELVDSVELSVDSDELFTRMLEIALDVTGADGGSVMLVDPETGTLRIRVAVGIERELWPKIRIAPGEGIAGRVAADRKPLRIDGRADHARFRVARERLDVESALCVPLIDGDCLLGVLNLHHSRQRGAFDDGDLAFALQLGSLDARIIARATEQATLRAQATRYAVGREVDTILSRPLPLAERLAELCRYTAESAGDGLVAISLRDEDEDVLRITAAAPSRPTTEQAIPIGLGIDGHVAGDGRPAFLLSDDGGLGYAALPLSAPTGTLGVLSIQTTRARSLDREGRDRFLEIATATGRFLAQLGREERIHDRANRLSATHETGMRLLSANDVDEIASLATSSLAMILGAEHAILRVEDATSGRIAIRSCFGPGDDAQRDALFALDKQVSVEALRALQPRLITEVRDEPGLSAHEAACRSLLVWPLQRDGRVVGTLAAYDKIEEARLLAGRFDEDDLETAGRFVAYVERALADASDRSRAREERSFDPDTGLPNERYLDRRMREEVARAEGQEAALALCICTIENVERIEAEGRPGQARLLVQRVAGALRRHVRGFDVVGRRTGGAFEILLPDPGPTPGDRIYALARAVADEIAKDEQLAGPIRPALGFGYAIHPYHGTDRDALLAAASPPRIRMV